MSDNVNLEKTLNAWAEIVIKTWQTKITMLNMNDTHGLFNSFMHHVNTNANGDPDRIDFAFNYYGKFVDMGVGNGVNLTNRDQKISLDMTRRRKKEWYSKVFYGQIQELKQILSEKYAMKASLTLMSNLESFDLDGKSTTTRKTTGSRSGSRRIDSVTGKKKITFKQFQQNRKDHGW